MQKARGRAILQKRIVNPEELKTFDEEGYRINPKKSTMDEWRFCNKAIYPLTIFLYEKQYPDPI